MGLIVRDGPGGIAKIEYQAAEGRNIKPGISFCVPCLRRGEGCFGFSPAAQNSATTAADLRRRSNGEKAGLLEYFEKGGEVPCGLHNSAVVKRRLSTGSTNR